MRFFNQSIFLDLYRNEKKKLKQENNFRFLIQQLKYRNICVLLN